MAAAYVARKMGVAATIVIPSSSPELVVQRLQDEGATVKISGKVSCGWMEQPLSWARRMKPGSLLRFGMMPTLKLSDWPKLKGSHTSLRSITRCSGTHISYGSRLHFLPLPLTSFLSHV